MRASDFAQQWWNGGMGDGQSEIEIKNPREQGVNRRKKRGRTYGRQDQLLVCIFLAVAAAAVAAVRTTERIVSGV